MKSAGGLRRPGQLLAVALLGWACSSALAQQASCSLPVNVVVPELSSLSKDEADDAVSVWTEETSNRTDMGYFSAGALGLLPLWTVVRGLPTEAFAAGDKKHPIPIGSVTVDAGPRRIVFVVDNGKDTTAAARRMEATVIIDILSKPRVVDSFALLTARGPRVALRLGSYGEIIQAAQKLDTPAARRSRGKAVLDALLEASTWLQPPQSGDSVLVLAMGIGGRHKASVSSLRKALAAAHIRLFAFQFGPPAFADLQASYSNLAFSVSNGMLSLSTRTGGVAVIENTVVYYGPNQYELTDETLGQLRRAAEQMYNAITKYYLVQPSFVGRHLSISLSPGFQKRLPPAVLLYPRELPRCSGPPPASPMGKGAGR